MNKKGQAALEFLMTYGWAILAAIVVIGVLAYFGVFSPGRYAPQACAVTAPFYCNAANAKTTGLTLEFKNQGGETFTVSNVTVSNCATAEVSQSVAADSAVVVTVPCALNEGDSFKGDITVSYLKSGSTVELSSTGSISQKVTA